MSGPTVHVKWCADWLEDKAENRTSQFGEDGLIAATLEVVGIENKWCFEVGAADGLFYSNTKTLRDDDWHGVLIEADAKAFDKLRQHASARVHCVHRSISPGNLDEVLAQWSAPTDLDLGVIDIDGDDYEVWESMQTYRPRLMLVEFNPHGSGPQKTLHPIQALGRSMGYTEVARTYVNCLFVLTSVLYESKLTVTPDV